MLLRLPQSVTSAVSSAMRMAGVAAETPQSALGSQARFATKVGAYNKARKLRNPWARHRKRVQHHEDTKMNEFWFYHDHWRYELRAWRAKFREVKDRKLARYDGEETQIPLNKPMYVTFALNAHKRGWPKYLQERPTMADNPFLSATGRGNFIRHRISRSGNIVSILRAEGITGKEFRHRQKEALAKYRQSKESKERKKQRSRLEDAKTLGMGSAFHSEFGLGDVDMGSQTGKSDEKALIPPTPREFLIWKKDDKETNLPIQLMTPELKGFAGDWSRGDQLRSPDVVPVEGVTSIQSPTYTTGRSALPEDYVFPHLRLAMM